MYTIKMPNGTILATPNKSVARGYIDYGGGEEIKENSSITPPKGRRGRPQKQPVSSSSEETE